MPLSSLLCRLLLLTGLLSGPAVIAQEGIPFSQLGAKATAEYRGEALGITPLPGGATLRCGFQKLAGRVTEEGLWLASTERGGQEGSAGGTNSGRSWDEFRIVASGLGRGQITPLPSTGRVTASDKLVQLLRPAVVEEYSVSADGVRQDFVILQRPEGGGKLRLALTVDGAYAKAAGAGAMLLLRGSQREITYSRLRVTDARGRELAAKIEVMTEALLHIVVEDTDGNTVYPLRIDPTFSDADWVALNADQLGVNGAVYAVAGDAAGNVYVGGSFTKAGTVDALNIARWDGTRWWPLAGGVSTPATALAVMNGEVFAGGTGSGVSRWDGTAWQALAASVQPAGGVVRAMVAKNGELYVGGSFTALDGLGVNRIAKWNPSAGWSALGSGTSGTVFALAADTTGVQAAGTFDTAGGVAAQGVAQWDGTSWTALGSGVQGTVYTLAWHEGKLWAGGSFATLGPVQHENLAQWDGTTWAAAPEGGWSDGFICSLVSNGGELFAGSITSSNSTWIYRYDSTPAADEDVWTSVGSVQGTVLAPWTRLAWADSDLIVGGDFSSTNNPGEGSLTTMNVCRWNGRQWRSLTRGLDRPVQALIVRGGSMWVGGQFHSIGGQEAGGIAKWNGSSWETLGGGTNGQVAVLWVEGDQVYAGGQFTTAGGLPAANVARWNGMAWEALGNGFQGKVRTLAVCQGTVYAGGRLWQALQSGENVASWQNGQTQWQAIMSADSVNALAVYNDAVIAGGRFNGCISRWTGTTWEPVGGGCDREAGALLVHEGRLYAGGRFTTAGSVPAAAIACWDGTAWSAMGAGLPNATSSSLGGVQGLAAKSDRVFAVTSPSGSIDIPVYQWDGTAWTLLGSGLTYVRYANIVVPAPVRSLAITPSGTLLVGGLFYKAGTLWSPFLVQANVPGSVLSARETWRQTHFGTYANEGDGADAADFDHDGVANLVEYAFGMNPTAGGSASGLPQPHVNGGNYEVSFAQPAGMTGMTYEAEWSATLQPGSWQPMTDTGTGSEHVFSVPVGLNTRIFVRLKVTGTQ